MLRKSRKGDVLSGRQAIWARVMDDLAALGNGGQYFETDVGINAHNAFMRIAGERGPFAAAALIAFALLSLLAGYRHAVSARSADYPAAPLLLLVYFWTMAQGEGMFGSFGSAATLSMYMAVGISIRGVSRFQTSRADVFACTGQS